MVSLRRAGIGALALAVIAGASAMPTAASASALESGDMDPAFAATGSGLSDSVYAVAVQPDGKIIVAGDFTAYNGTTRSRVARLNSDGTLDTSFAQTGTGLNGSVYAMVLQSDGKMLVGGAFTSYNGTSRARIARLNADGTLDTAFTQTGSGLNGTVRAISLGTDGKLLAGGDFTSYNATPEPHVAQLTSTGSLDTSFAQTGTGISGSVHAITRQADGRIVVGGSFLLYDVVGEFDVARLNSNGTLDYTFQPSGTGLSDAVNAIVIQPDGKIVVGGAFTNYNTVPVGHLVRLNSNGSRDMSFTASGSGFDHTVTSIVRQPNGQMLVAGPGSSAGVSVAKVNSDGSQDPSFDVTPQGMVQGRLTGTALAVALLPDSKVIVGGQFTSVGWYDLGIFRSAPAIKVVRLVNDVTAPSAQVTTQVPDGISLNTAYPFQWTATDDWDGVQTQALTRSKSFGGAFGDWVPTSLGRNVSMDVGLTPGTSYCVMVRAIDVAGNSSTASASPCVTSPLDDRSMSKTRGWKRKSLSGSSAYRGTVTVGNRVGAKLTTPAASGSSLVVYVRKVKGGGKVRVLVGGRSVAVINTSSRRTQSKVAVRIPLAVVGTPLVLKIVKSGKKGVAIDGVAVLP